MPAVDLPSEYSVHLARQGFILGNVLGQGLSGSVYEATQPSLNRKVAVKFFDSAFIRGDEAMRKRFVREAKLLARFQHQGLPYVLTEGQVSAPHGLTPYFVMEYVDGVTLEHIVNNGQPINQSTAIDYAVQVLDALGYAHHHQIVHRDVKPRNIMVDSRGRCFLIDFSIGVSFETTPGLTRATVAGEQLGTPPYTAPEQFVDASNVDERADIYSLGIVLLEMLTGRTDRTNITRIMSGFPWTISSSIERACATDPVDRFRSADDFIRALGGRQQAGAPSLSPALAICANAKCPGADWTERGYYRGPQAIQDSTRSYCTSCGGQLTYRCTNCGVDISHTPFCGNCGAAIYRVPECKVCGSWLTIEYMDTGGESGCRKCKTKSAPGVAAMDEDIPF